MTDIFTEDSIREYLDKEDMLLEKHKDCRHVWHPANHGLYCNKCIASFQVTDYIAWKLNYEREEGP